MDEDEDTSAPDYLYLESQLKLFGKLCLNRNSRAIDIITKPPLRYLTWQEVSICAYHVVADRGFRPFTVSRARNYPRAFALYTAIF